MRILLFSEWFSEGMGYSENCLPKALADLGHDVHMVTSDAQIYFNSPTYKKIYEPFLGLGVVRCGVKLIDGYTLYRLPHYYFKGYMWIRGLLPMIKQIQPEIIQTFDPNTISTLLLAISRPALQYKLFIESHVHASVLSGKQQKGIWKVRLKGQLQKAIGRIISWQSTRCYPISEDAAEVARDYYGVNEKILKVQSLGVDTDVFRPAREPDDLLRRKTIREALSFSAGDVVAIYTGRLSEDKNPYCLAQAIELLSGRVPLYRGLFIGDGPQSEAIKATPGCVVLPFMPAAELGDYYRAAEIGVWPKQESTSQLDAACCGLPIIISDHTRVPERIDGNGLTYCENDASDLAKKLLQLNEKDLRAYKGTIGYERISSQFSWKLLASKRIADYEEALLCD